MISVYVNRKQVSKDRHIKRVQPKGKNSHTKRCILEVQSKNMPQICYQQKRNYKKKNSQQLPDQHKTMLQHTVYLCNGRATKSNDTINRL